MKNTHFGNLPTGEEVSIYKIGDENCIASIMDFGATITGFECFGKDIIGGFDSLTDYLNDTSHQGGTIGRVANRVGGATFNMDGAIYMLPDNDNGNCLHGGCGFDRRIWTVKEHKKNSIIFTYFSEDGEEGFPGGLDVTVTYTITDDTLLIDYKATPTAKTPIALTNHSYFNLNGFAGTILTHKVKIHADKYTEVDENLIPNGKRPCVNGTPFDFTEPHEIGERIGGDFIGYDHNFVINSEISKEIYGQSLSLIAEIEADELCMEVYSDQPGVQFYIGNFLGDGPSFKGGVKQIRHGAFCLETQTEPNIINRGEAFYDAGQTYTHTTAYKIKKKGE